MWRITREQGHTLQGYSLWIHGLTATHFSNWILNFDSSLNSNYSVFNFWQLGNNFDTLKMKCTFFKVPVHLSTQYLQNMADYKTTHLFSEIQQDLIVQMAVNVQVIISFAVDRGRSVIVTPQHIERDPVGSEDQN